MVVANIFAEIIIPLSDVVKEMMKKDKGHILNVASIAGFMVGPLMATYYASKNYVVRLSEAIREELHKAKSDVKISILCPGPVKTNFNDVANVKFSVKSLTSKYVAEYAIKKLERGKRTIEVLKQDLHKKPAPLRKQAEYPD